MRAMKNGRQFAKRLVEMHVASERFISQLWMGEWRIVERLKKSGGERWGETEKAGRGNQLSNAKSTQSINFQRVYLISPFAQRVDFLQTTSSFGGLSAEGTQLPGRLRRGRVAQNCIDSVRTARQVLPADDKSDRIERLHRRRGSGEKSTRKRIHTDVQRQNSASKAENSSFASLPFCRLPRAVCSTRDVIKSHKFRKIAYEFVHERMPATTTDPNEKRGKKRSVSPSEKLIRADTYAT